MSKYFIVAITAILCTFTGCYRMPKEGEVSVVPNTNNPSNTRQGNGWAPGIDY